jgi:hypothetical protein
MEAIWLRELIFAGGNYRQNRGLPFCISQGDNSMKCALAIATVAALTTLLGG